MKFIQQTFNSKLDKIIQCTLFSYKEFSPETLISFEYKNKKYIFQLFFNRHEMIRTLNKYILETNNRSFGFYDQDGFLNISYNQKNSFREKVAKDFMNCLNYYFEKYRYELLSFAVFLHGKDYFEYKKDESYSKYIERIVCQFIIENKFTWKHKFPILEWKVNNI
jgi:hypothetical protein